jgi:hypothetical protein
MKTFKSNGIIANYHNNYFEKRKEMRKKAKNNYCIWPSNSGEDSDFDKNDNEELFKSFFKNNLYYKEE